MRILHVSSAKTFGGGERHLVDLCRELQARGHEVHVVLRPTNQWQSRLDFLPASRILHASIRNAFGIFSAKKIARYVRDNGIELVHAHAARDYIPASLVCRMSSGIRFVLTRHVLFPMKPFHRVALRNVSKVIAVSGAVAENLRAIFPASKIVMIPNGMTIGEVDDERRAAMREEFRFFHEIPFDSPLIGTVGELKPLKGQLDFVIAASEIAKRNPEAHFIIVGRDNTVGQEFRRELKRMARVLGIDRRFTFLDWIDDLPALLAALDVFVSPSHSESFGLVILESMLSGVPVVATRTDGAKELLDDGKTGLIVPVGDPVAVSGAVSKMLNDRPYSARISAAARKVGLDRFSLKQMVDQTEAVYRGD